MQPDVTKVVTPFEYRAHDDTASAVALAGEWTAWSAVPMHRVGNGTWSLDVILPAGPHHFKFVVDSNNWCTSPMYDTADDGQGGLNNVRLVTPDGPKDTTPAPVPMHNGDAPPATEKACSANGPDQPQLEKKQDQANCRVM